MRLDMFLKNARLLKQRSVAKMEAAEGRVLLNGHSAKPGRDVHPGDRLTLLPDESDRGIERTFEILAEPLRPIHKGDEAKFYRPIQPTRDRSSSGLS